ncbi:PadR family transcriptional regulator [Curtobacterium ammoniigenes]|uniref:PadR family transcriptional regulator n=1 Tax=Curtobacterium ammoniigenes TaxID=395387 RepID=UPI00083419F3|nr:PadR family transcriptional regulator [Curtobacterium ammoniigenes]
MESRGIRDPGLSILTVLAAGRRHGYAIIQEAERISEGRVRLKVSSLYAALDRLTVEGLVVRDGDESVDGRLRRYFALTEAGADALEHEADQLEKQANAARRGLSIRRGSLQGGAA